MHEHAFILHPEIIQNYPEDCGSKDERADNALTRMNELKSHGVDSIVDFTVTGLGRYVPRIARIAARAELNIPDYF